MDLWIPSFSDIEKAHERIKKYIHRTPVFSSSAINSIAEAQCFFKCENFQKVGAFKFRGATNAVLSLDDSSAQNGVATHSSGNHAAALALAAAKRGIPAYIVMPDNSPEIKKKAVAGYGGRITYCEPTLKARENTLYQVVKETGATFIHPYDSFYIIAGQGTAALELLDEISDLDSLIVPVGGGGLLSGSAITAKHMHPTVEVIAAEPKGADDAWQSFQSGRIIPSEKPQTIADGLLTSLSERTFEVIQTHVNDILTVKEESIASAMRLIWERMKIIVEPSAAVTLALILENKSRFKNKKIGFILSGGNVDLNRLPF